MTGEPVIEAELLHGCRSGDPRAAAALIDRHQHVLLRTVFRLVGRMAVAEDVVQEAFLRLFERIDRIDPEKGARSWLLATSLNLARNHMKHIGLREEGLDSQAASQPLTPNPIDPEEEAARSERRVRVERALVRLSPKLREVMVLHYVEGLAFPDIAAVLHLPLSALKMRAFRARVRLKALLAERE